MTSLTFEGVFSSSMGTCSILSVNSEDKILSLYHIENKEEFLCSSLELISSSFENGKRVYSFQVKGINEKKIIECKISEEKVGSFSQAIESAGVNIGQTPQGKLRLAFAKVRLSTENAVVNSPQIQNNLEPPKNRKELNDAIGSSLMIVSNISRRASQENNIKENRKIIQDSHSSKNLKDSPLVIETKDQIESISFINSLRSQKNRQSQQKRESSSGNKSSKQMEFSMNQGINFQRNTRGHKNFLARDSSDFSSNVQRFSSSSQKKAVKAFTPIHRFSADQRKLPVKFNRYSDFSMNKNAKDISELPQDSPIKNDLKNIEEFKRLETFVMNNPDFNSDGSDNKSLRFTLGGADPVRRGTIDSTKNNNLSEVSYMSSSMSRRAFKNVLNSNPLTSEIHLPEKKLLEDHESLSKLVSARIEQNRMNFFFKIVDKAYKALQNYKTQKVSSKTNVKISNLKAFLEFFDKVNLLFSIESNNKQKKTMKSSDYIEAINSKCQIASRRRQFNFRVKKKEPTKVFVEENFKSQNVHELPYPSNDITKIKDSMFLCILKEIENEFCTIISNHFNETAFNNVIFYSESGEPNRRNSSVAFSFCEELGNYLCSLLTKGLSINLFKLMLGHILLQFNQVACGVATFFRQYFYETKVINLSRLSLIFLKIFDLHIEEIQAIFVSFFTTCLDVNNFYKENPENDQKAKEIQNNLLISIFKKDAQSILKSSNFSDAELIHGLVAVVFKDKFSILMKLREHIQGLFLMLR